MKRLHLGVCAALAVAVSLLDGCGNGGASEPTQTSYDPAATSKLQLAVGIATISSQNGQKIAYGLNEVETLRQSNGLSGTLYNVPVIVGPSEFDVLISTQTGQEVQSAGNDVGTNHITWGTLNQAQWLGAPRGMKQSSTGAFGYGLCACNSDSGPINGFTPLFEAYNLPIYGDHEELWYGGPPAFPAAGLTLRALGWLGYSMGFTDFAVAPVVGTYHLYAAVPPAYDTPQNPTPSPNPNGTPTPPPGILAAASQLTSLNALPVFDTPTFKPDRKGGGTVGIKVPAGVREAMVVVRATARGSGICSSSQGNGDAFYALVAEHAGSQKLTLADNLGPITQSGKATPTMCSGEFYEVYAVGADYPAYESSYPKSLAQLPTIAGRNGQADVTTSDYVSGTYP
ncbi:MAG: hypothetical protein WAK16_00715 [Candidatus Cybelea sp.]